ncbi:hypothetical protein Syun_023250 [Stephania yunnanensis]|uniref:Uncharacterized protein n=1 Tax=Stephania yunnanensis TaxID=152371 RepID=A0AAP0F9B7_9MAGN
MEVNGKTTMVSVSILISSATSPFLLTHDVPLVPKKRFMTEQKSDVAHTYILLKCDEAAPYIL